MAAKDSKYWENRAVQLQAKLDRNSKKHKEEYAEIKLLYTQLTKKVQDQTEIIHDLNESHKFYKNECEQKSTRMRELELEIIRLTRELFIIRHMFAAYNMQVNSPR